jgi:hypothetical protein
LAVGPRAFRGGSIGLPSRSHRRTRQPRRSATIAGSKRRSGAGKTISNGVDRLSGMP